MSTSSGSDPSSGPAQARSGTISPLSNGIRKSGGNRRLLLAASITLAVGFTALALSVWFNDVTADDGTGANIGAGILGLLGGVIGAAGLIMLLVVTIGAIATSSRR